MTAHNDRFQCEGELSHQDAGIFEQADEREIWHRHEGVAESINEALKSLSESAELISASSSGWLLDAVASDPIVMRRFDELLQREGLSGQLDNMAINAREETFRDGFESILSKDLLDFISAHGVSAIKQLRSKILGKVFPSRVAEEAIRWLGLAQDPTSHVARRSFLSEMICNDDYALRDAALVALSDMDDPKAIPVLRESVRHAEPEEFKRDLVSVLDQLEDTVAASSKDDKQE